MKKFYRFCYIALLFIILILTITACGNKTSDVWIPNSPKDNLIDSKDNADFLPGDLKDDESRELEPEKSLVFHNIIHGLKDEFLGYPIAVDQDKNGNIYILDVYSTDGMVKVFDYQGNYLDKLVALEDSQSNPVDLAIDDKENIYIADLGLGAVLKYNKNKLVAKIQPKEKFHPRSITMDSLGNLLVLSFDKVFKFTPGQGYNIFGRSGDGDGEFGAAGSEFYVGPTGITVDENNHIYVADTLNNRIQKFDSQGQFVKAFPLDEGVFPQDVSIDKNGNMDVITYSGNLLKLNPQGNLVKSQEVINTTQGSSGTYTLARGMEDILFVVLPEKHQVKVYSDGMEVYALSSDISEGFIYPHNMKSFQDSIVILAGDPFCNDELNHRVMIFSKEGKFIKEIFPGYKGTGFFGPTDISFYRDKIYLLDLDLISVFDKQGNFINSFGGRGQNPGDLGFFDNYGYIQGPEAIESLPDGSLLISDTFNNRIQRLSAQGKYQGDFPVEYPGAMAVDKTQKIYILSPKRGRVEKYSLSGEKLLEFGKIGDGEGEFTLENTSGSIFYGPKGITVDHSKGNIYVSDTEGHRILVFDKKGSYIKTIGGFGTGNKGFYYPRSLYIEEDGILWIADSGNHRIVSIKI